MKYFKFFIEGFMVYRNIQLLRPYLIALSIGFFKPTAYADVVTPVLPALPNCVYTDSFGNSGPGILQSNGSCQSTSTGSLPCSVTYNINGQQLNYTTYDLNTGTCVVPVGLACTDYEYGAKGTVQSNGLCQPTTGAACTNPNTNSQGVIQASGSCAGVVGEACVDNNTNATGTLQANLSCKPNVGASCFLYNNNNSLSLNNINTSSISGTIQSNGNCQLAEGANCIDPITNLPGNTVGNTCRASYCTSGSSPYGIPQSNGSCVLQVGASCYIEIGLYTTALGTVQANGTCMYSSCAISTNTSNPGTPSSIINIVEPQSQCENFSDCTVSVTTGGDPGQLGAPGQLQPNGECQALSTSDPNLIFQGNANGASSTVISQMQIYEANAVSNVRTTHKLPPGDINIVYDAARSEVRAGILGQLLTVAQKSDWDTNESAVMNYYAGIVKQRRQLAANYALQEYNSWSSNICNVGPGQNANGTGWSPPQGFSYDWSTQSIPACSTSTGGIFGGNPIPPSFNDFMTYGYSYVNYDVTNNPGTYDAFTETANAVSYGVASAATAGAVTGTGLISFGILAATAADIGYDFVSSISFSFITTTIIADTTTAINTSILTIGGAASFVAGPVAVALIAIEIGVIEGINVVTNAQLPAQLQSAVTAAATAPNMTQLTDPSNTVGLGEFYTAFIQTTTPEYLPSLTPPNAQPTDPEFYITDETTNIVSTATQIQLKTPISNTYNTVRSLPSAAGYTGGWLAVTTTSSNNVSSPYYSTYIDYLDWNGNQMRAWRQGNTFVHTQSQSNNPAAGVVNSNIQYQDLNGALKTAILTTASVPSQLLYTKNGNGGQLLYTLTGPGSDQPAWFTGPTSIQWSLVNSPVGKSLSAYPLDQCPDSQITTEGYNSAVCSLSNLDGIQDAFAHVNIDSTSPNVQSSPVPQPNTWYNHLKLSFICGDVLSGVAAGSCPNPVTLPEGTGVTQQVKVSDIAGNTATFTTQPANNDNTPPSIQYVFDGGKASLFQGWTTGPITVNFVCYDYLSGIASCSAPQNISGDGKHTVTGSATDIAGLSTSITVQFSIDSVTPTITATVKPQPNSNGWNNSIPVTVSFNCSTTGVSGIQYCSPAQSFTTQGVYPNQYAAGVVANYAGEGPVIYVPVNIDTTPPSCSIGSTPSVIPATNDMVTVTNTVNSSDNLSGVAKVNLYSLTSSYGGNALGWTVGSNSLTGSLQAVTDQAGDPNYWTFIYQVTDNAGNSSFCSNKVTISSTIVAPVAYVNPINGLSLPKIGDTVNLTGSFTSIYDNPPHQYSYTWSLTPPGGLQTAGLQIPAIANANTLTPSFVPNFQGEWLAHLVVTDVTTGASSTPYSIFLIVEPLPAVANAGPNQTVVAGSTVTLQGSGSINPAYYTNQLTYQWLVGEFPLTCYDSNQNNICPEILSNPTSPTTTFIAPSIPGTYQFILVVTNGPYKGLDGLSDDSYVYVNVISPQTATINAVQALQSYISGLSSSTFTNAAMQNALVNTLNTVITDINNQNYSLALSILNNNALAHSQSCSVPNAVNPSNKDWFKTCAAEQQVLSLVQPAVNYLTQLIAP
ncbi:MAG: hypothetical protein ABSB19_00630 [Methylomonas sp.]